MAKGVLAVVSGFSGVGKGTLVRELIRRNNQYGLSVSCTTRKPRVGEVNGREYFFISKEEFEKGISEGNFLEYTCYLDNYYGTPKNYVLEQLSKGRNIILEIEMEGGLNVKKAYPEAKLIFVIPPSQEVLEKRLRGRGTETDEEIQKRLARAEVERSFIQKYDYTLVNDDIETAINNLETIISGK